MDHLLSIERQIRVRSLCLHLHNLQMSCLCSSTIFCHDIEGTETIKLLPSDAPAVITCDLRLNTPRYPTMPNIMKAKKKPVQVISLEDMVAELGLDLDDILKPKNQVVEVYEPPPRKEGEFVESVDELVGKLREKGVIG